MLFVRRSRDEWLDSRTRGVMSIDLISAGGHRGGSMRCPYFVREMTITAKNRWELMGKNRLSVQSFSGNSPSCSEPSEPAFNPLVVGSSPTGPTRG